MLLNPRQLDQLHGPLSGGRSLVVATGAMGVGAAIIVEKLS